MRWSAEHTRQAWGSFWRASAWWLPTLFLGLVAFVWWHLGTQPLRQEALTPLTSERDVFLLQDTETRLWRADRAIWTLQALRARMQAANAHTILEDVQLEIHAEQALGWSWRGRSARAEYEGQGRTLALQGDVYLIHSEGDVIQGDQADYEIRERRLKVRGNAHVRTAEGHRLWGQEIFAYGELEVLEAHKDARVLTVQGMRIDHAKLVRYVGKTQQMQTQGPLRFVDP